MKVVRGDLVKLALDGRLEVIIHGCNCQCVMGAGIARMIKQTFPEAYEADLATLKGLRDKLGSLSTATVERSGRKISIVNGYTQIHWRGSGVLVDYDALQSVMQKVKVMFSGRTIGTRKSARVLPKAIGLSSPLSSIRRGRITRSSNMSGDEDRCFGRRENRATIVDGSVQLCVSGAATNRRARKATKLLARGRPTWLWDDRIIGLETTVWLSRLDRTGRRIGSILPRGRGKAALLRGRGQWRGLPNPDTMADRIMHAPAPFFLDLPEAALGGMARPIYLNDCIGADAPLESCITVEPRFGPTDDTLPLAVLLLAASNSVRGRSGRARIFDRTITDKQCHGSGGDGATLVGQQWTACSRSLDVRKLALTGRPLQEIGSPSSDYSDLWAVTGPKPHCNRNSGLLIGQDPHLRMAWRDRA